MSKVKNLKNHIKSNPVIFDRIINNYRLNNPSSFLHEYLDYSSDKGSLRIALVSNRMVKVLKQEGNTKTVEIVKLIGDEPTATERIKTETHSENIKRKYRDNKLKSLSKKVKLSFCIHEKVLAPTSEVRQVAFLGKRQLTFAVVELLLLKRYHLRYNHLSQF